MSEVPVEVFPVKDVFADELSLVEEIGGDCVRFTLTVNQRIGVNTERVVVARLIMPKSAVAPAQAITNAILDGKRIEELPLAAGAELH